MTVVAGRMTVVTGRMTVVAGRMTVDVVRKTGGANDQPEAVVARSAPSALIRSVLLITRTWVCCGILFPSMARSRLAVGRELVPSTSVD